MTKKTGSTATKRLLTGADFREAGKKLREIDVFDSDGEAMGVVYLRPVSAKDVLGYDEDSDKKEVAVEMLAKFVVDADGAPIWASTEEVKEIPLLIFNALSTAVMKGLGVRGSGEHEGNVSGGADGSASPTA